MMPRLSLKTGPLFFDSRKLIDLVTKAKRKVMSGQGAFVRRKAKSSLKRGSKSWGVERHSNPGQPPLVDSRRSDLRRLIFFVYDPIDEDVVIGPVGISTRGQRMTTNEFGKTTPQRLEEGGAVVMYEEFTRKEGWHKTNRRSFRKTRLPKRSRRTTVGARPVMKPALTKGTEEWVRKWEGAVK